MTTPYADVADTATCWRLLPATCCCYRARAGTRCSQALEQESGLVIPAAGSSGSAGELCMIVDDHDSLARLTQGQAQMGSGHDEERQLVRHHCRVCCCSTYVHAHTGNNTTTLGWVAPPTTWSLVHQSAHHTKCCESDWIVSQLSRGGDGSFFCREVGRFDGLHGCNILCTASSDGPGVYSQQ